MGTGRSTTRAQHSFARVPSANIQRSVFNRSFGHKTTFDAGRLIPIMVDEALPGDTFRLKMSAFARLATPLHPFMDNLYLDVQFFAVPLRLVWDNFQKFMGEQDNPTDSTDYLIPTVDLENSPITGLSIYDYMGLPVQSGATGYMENPNALPFRAYNLIWNEWYRDENINDSIIVNKGDGPDAKSDYWVQFRQKRHDYFTSCLPWPQKGPAVELSFGGTAPLVGIAYQEPKQDTGLPTWNSGGNTVTLESVVGQSNTTWSGTTATDTPKWSDPQLETNFGNPVNAGVYADLNQATAATINQIRQAFQIQRMYERDARGGSRYTEILRSHFGVISPDARLQRPEYLGGGTFPVNINPVPQTSSTDATTAQGNLAAFGVASSGSVGFSKSFVEHSYVIGLISARADLTYQEGINKLWSRSTKFDFYWPTLSHLGEQAVLNKEIHFEGDQATGDAVFGYQERYAEYRYKPSMVTGQMRSRSQTPLDTWHLAQEFSNTPTLSPEFMQEMPPVDRVSAVPSEPHFIIDTFFNYRCVRPMPIYSVPGMIDHF